MATGVINFTEKGRYNLGLVLAVLHSFMSFFGFGLIAAGIYIKVELDSRMILMDHYTTDPVPYMLISVGILLIIFHGVAVIMCYSCAKLKTRDRFQGAFLALMVSFLVLVLVIFSGGIMCFTHQGYMKAAFTGGILKSMKKYGVKKDTKLLLDELQMSYKCCGSRNHTDWFKVDWVDQKYVDRRVDLIIGRMAPRPYKDHVPFSCCDPASMQPCIHTFVNHTMLYRNYKESTLYKKGCVRALMDYFELILVPAGRVVLSLFGAEWFILLMMKYFYTSMRNAALWGDPAMPAPGWLLETCCCLCCDPDMGRPYKPPAHVTDTANQSLSQHYPEPAEPPPIYLDDGYGNLEAPYYDDDSFIDYGDDYDNNMDQQGYWGYQGQEGYNDYQDEPIYENIDRLQQMISQNQTMDYGGYSGGYDQTANHSEGMHPSYGAADPYQQQAMSSQFPPHGHPQHSPQGHPQAQSPYQTSPHQAQHGHHHGSPMGHQPHEPHHGSPMGHHASPGTPHHSTGHPHTMPGHSPGMHDGHSASRMSHLGQSHHDVHWEPSDHDAPSDMFGGEGGSKKKSKKGSPKSKKGTPKSPKKGTPKSSPHRDTPGTSTKTSGKSPRKKLFGSPESSKKKSPGRSKSPKGATGGSPRKKGIGSSKRKSPGRSKSPKGAIGGSPKRGKLPGLKKPKFSRKSPKIPKTPKIKKPKLKKFKLKKFKRK